MTKKHKHHKHKAAHRVIEPATIKGPKVKIRTDGKLKRVSFVTQRPNWGKKVKLQEN